ncbi:hypothetical protein ACFOU2_25540 [Bacillus songklensis]|uniref:Alkaliphily related protein n=1 Tax=Bacillus songklensis TaxID=1069116 RepID=A0ABV8BBK8_9BACI
MAVGFSFIILLCFFVGLVLLLFGFKRKSKILLGGSLFAFLLGIFLTYLAVRAMTRM